VTTEMDFQPRSIVMTHACVRAYINTHTMCSMVRIHFPWPSWQRPTCHDQPTE